MLAGVGRIGRIGGAGSGSAAGLTGFVSVWATTGAFETITIPCQNLGTFNAVVDWGDSSPPETITTYNGFSHVYDDIGDHTISITGTFPNIFFNSGGDKLKIKRVTNLGTVGWATFRRAFEGCTNLTGFTAGSTDTSAVTDMFAMFNACTGLTTVDASFDTSSVTSMFAMFQTCSGLTSLVGVEDWDITGLDSTNDLTNFLTGGKMTTAQYDNLLVKWQAQVQVTPSIPAMTASFGASIHSPEPSRGYTAKVLLVAFFSWTISDGVTP